MRRPRKKFDPIRLFHKIKLLAFEAGITIVFIYWVVKEVRHQLGWDRPAPSHIERTEPDSNTGGCDSSPQTPPLTAVKSGHGGRGHLPRRSIEAVNGRDVEQSLTAPQHHEAIRPGLARMVADQRSILRRDLSLARNPGSHDTGS